MEKDRRLNDGQPSIGETSRECSLEKRLAGLAQTKGGNDCPSPLQIAVDDRHQAMDVASTAPQFPTDEKSGHKALWDTTSTYLPEGQICAVEAPVSKG